MFGLTGVRGKGGLGAIGDRQGGVFLMLMLMANVYT